MPEGRRVNTGERLRLNSRQRPRSCRLCLQSRGFARFVRRYYDRLARQCQRRRQAAPVLLQVPAAGREAGVSDCAGRYADPVASGGVHSVPLRFQP